VGAGARGEPDAVVSCRRPGFGWGIAHLRVLVLYRAWTSSVPTTTRERRSMQAIERSVSIGLLIAGICAAGAVGCKDQQKCDEALSTARKAMQDDFLDMALARQWREHAGKLCGAGPELQALDKAILDKEAAIQKAIEDKAKAEAEAGKKAMDKAAAVWAKYDKLDDKERDKDALKKHDKRARKLTSGLTPEYAKQVDSYNKAQFKKRQKDLKK